MNWYVEVLKKYAVFGGRAHRQEFWMFVLFNVIISFVLAIIDTVIGTNVGTGASSTGVLGGLYSLAVLIPSLAVTVRRLHDTGRSGWWWFIVLVPFVGWIVLLVFVVLDGNAGANAYGTDPKERAGSGATPAAAGVGPAGYPPPPPAPPPGVAYPPSPSTPMAAPATTPPPAPPAAVPPAPAPPASAASGSPAPAAPSSSPDAWVAAADPLATPAAPEEDPFEPPSTSAESAADAQGPGEDTSETT